MHVIELSPPRVDGQSVLFRWTVEPATSLYRQTSFSLTFPHSVDLGRVPPRLWWDIFLLCLHPHWLLLRPCKIALPLQLGNAECRFWLQLLQNGADTLSAYGPEQTRNESLGIAIEDGTLSIPRATISGAGYATSFSGGKDSLLQAGLLCELTSRPLLVTTTSPMPPLNDHSTARRRKILESIPLRRELQLVEVTSDFRRIWDNSFAGSLGYPLAVNELTDTHLYTSSLLAAGAALGATRLFVASEAELQVSDVTNGRIIQHSHFMYAAATQRAVSRLLEPYGICLSSLTWPLPSMLVQRLLWDRFPDISDLQYSCWRVKSDEATCSRCEQCLRTAVTALAGGHDPTRMGIDLKKVLRYARVWARPSQGCDGAPIRPQDREADILERRVMKLIGDVSLAHVARLLACQNVLKFPLHAYLLWQFSRIQRRSRQLPEPSPPAVKEAFLDLLEPELRSKLEKMYTDYFPREPRELHAGDYERSLALTSRATACLSSIVE